MEFGFDFFLRVFKDRFNGEGDATDIQFYFSDIHFNLKSENTNRVVISTNGITVTVEEASHAVLEKINELKEDDLLYHIDSSRIVILAEITRLVKGTTHLTKIAELLIQYFHMILIERDIREEDGALLELAVIRLRDLCTESVNYAVYHDPGALV